MKNWNFLILAAATMFCFVSCDKSDTDWTFASDNATSENAFQDVYKVSNNVADGNGNNMRTGCATITHTSANPGVVFPDVITVDFGTVGNVCADGRTRKGVITITMTGRWRDAGSVLTATTTNYEVNGYKVVGTQTVTNTTTTTGTNPTFHVVVNNAQVTNPQIQTNTWSSDCVVEWTAGSNTTSLGGTSQVADDVFSITGGGNGTSHTGQAYTMTITTPVVHRMDCKYPVSGVVQVTPTGGSARTIDFGTGSTCNGVVTVSYRRLTTTLNLIM